MTSFTEFRQYEMKKNPPRPNNLQSCRKSERKDSLNRQKLSHSFNDEVEEERKKERTQN